MISTLKNKFIKAEINTYGAELNSIKNISDETEYLWNADEKVWNRHAPILFPIVGMVKENKYKLNGKEYNIKQHGFVRNMEFYIKEQSKEQIVYEVKENELTLEKYPFKFLLTIKYTLINNQIQIEYVVKNTDTKDMWFSIGGHPGFSCPFEKNKKYEDYYIEFEQNETAYRKFAEAGLITDKKEVVLENSNIIPLSRDLFNNDALIFKDLKSKKVFLKCNGSQKGIGFTFEGFQYLGIWSKPQEDSNFVCLEPWFGIADSVNSDGDFTKKDGIIKLEAEKEFNCKYSIEIL